uniref:Putative ovule protein n=1 Tax=Solanum chacoense TaxID=4108 RepID=A0A0V0GPN9_SOLCH
MQFFFDNREIRHGIFNTQTKHSIRNNLCITNASITKQALQYTLFSIILHSTKRPLRVLLKKKSHDYNKFRYSIGVFLAIFSST